MRYARGFCFSEDHCCTVFNRRYAYDKAGNLLWYGEYTAWGRLKGRMGLSERTSAVQVAKTSVMMKRLDCTTT